MRSLAGLERCDRPTSAFFSTAGDQPGRLAQGPEEKLGFAGRNAGLAAFAACLSVILLPFQIGAPRWGGVAR